MFACCQAKIIEKLIEENMWEQKWCLPKKPTVRRLLHREKELEQVKNYVSNPAEFASKDNI